MNYTLDLNGKRYSLTESFREALQERARLEYQQNARFSCWWKIVDGDPVLTIETMGPTVPWGDIDQLNMKMEQGDNPYGRTHFGLTPHEYEEVPDPGGDDPSKIPPKPDRVDSSMMVIWVPEHEEADEVWSTTEVVSPVDSWVEWNVQSRADQPSPHEEEGNCHDSFESLCNIHDCEVIAEAEPSNDIPTDISGQVERKGEEAYKNGRYDGNNWEI